MQATQSARVQVLWQPGCSSCLRTKEFLIEQRLSLEDLKGLSVPDEVWDR